MNDRQSRTDSPVTPRDAAALIKGRRTVDQFRADEQPARSLILEAIDVARWAPNHHLTQPWRFSLLGPVAQNAVLDLNTELLSAQKGPDVAAAKRQRWAAMPGWLVVTCVRGDDAVTAQEDYAACACAIQNLCLFLHAAGVGTKWASGAVTRDRRFIEITGGDPDQEYAVGLLWYGFPRKNPRSQRVPLAEVVRERD